METMEEILPKVEHLYIMEGSQHPALPLINLSQRGNQAQKPAPAAQSPASPAAPQQ